MPGVNDQWWVDMVVEWRQKEETRVCIARAMKRMRGTWLFFARRKQVPHGYCLQDFPALLNDIQTVGCEIGQLVGGTRRPADLNGVGLHRTVEAEVDSEVVL